MTDLAGARVRVHYNLHRGGFVVSRGGRVACYADDVTLTGASFRVQPGGLRRIRERKQRAVCAYVVGTLAALDTAPYVGGLRRVAFNPYRADTFTTDDGQPVTTAGRVIFSGHHGWTS